MAKLKRKRDMTVHKKVFTNLNNAVKILEMYNCLPKLSKNKILRRVSLYMPTDIREFHKCLLCGSETIKDTMIEFGEGLICSPCHYGKTKKNI